MQFAQRIDDQMDSNLEALLAAPTAGQVSFAGGLPDPQLFPERALSSAFSHALTTAGTQCLQYASAAGYEPLRQKIAHFLRRDGVPARPDNVMLTQGAQQALDLTARLFINPGDGLVVEGPTYAGALAAFDAYQPHYLSIPVRNDGMDMTLLRRTLEQNPVKLLYTVPDFQNPTGTVMSLRKRQQLLALAREFDFIILEDAPYRSLRYRGISLPTLRELDSDDRVIHVGSFSKILSPGLRLGWLTAAPALLNRLITLKSGADLETSNLMMRAIDSYLSTNDLGQHIRQLRSTYAAKEASMAAALQNLPQGVSCSQPDGGFFLWLTLPEGCDSERILSRCRDHVTFVPSSTLYAARDNRRGIRLAFTNPSTADIQRGCAALCSSIRQELVSKQIARSVHHN